MCRPRVPHCVARSTHSALSRHKCDTKFQELKRKRRAQEAARPAGADPLVCVRCGRQCASATGRASHERSCKVGSNVTHQSVDDGVDEQQDRDAVDNDSGAGDSDLFDPADSPSSASVVRFVHLVVILLTYTPHRRRRDRLCVSTRRVVDGRSSKKLCCLIIVTC